MNKISKNLTKLWEFKGVLIFSALIFFLLLFFLFSFNLNSRYFIILLVVPILVTLLLNFQTIVKIFFISLFIEFGIYYFYLPTLLFPFVALSFLINIKFNPLEVKNKILNYFLVFIIAIIPSYFEALRHPESYLISYNLFAFVILLMITPFILNSIKDIKSLGILYMVACSINGIYLIVESFSTGKRAFGFSGIMYVDLVGIGIVISYSSFLFYKKNNLLFGAVTILLILALLFTQTRNAWISSGVIMILISFFYVIKKVKYKKINLYNPKRIILVLTTLLILVISAEFIFPNVFSRVSSHRQETTEELATTMDLGSIATRFFIWQIAFDVFKSNPIVGTGFHSFRFVSVGYSKLNPFLYNTFVYNLTPHTTILALLSDTGIIGFIGFLIFIFYTLRFFKDNMLKSVTEDQNIIGFILFWCQIYILISMIMTDAWLWGTLHMLWALILGSAVYLNTDIEKSLTLQSSH